MNIDLSEVCDGDYVEAVIFGKKVKVELFAGGENKFTKDGDYKERGFKLTTNEVDLLKWILGKDYVTEYANQILEYCSNKYEEWCDNPPNLKLEDLHREVQFDQIVIRYFTEEDWYSSNYDKDCYPDVAIIGGCLCDEENGISINFLRNKFIGIDDCSMLF